MPLFKAAETRGHDLARELHEHIQDFHVGLAEFKADLLHRRGVVDDRLANLENEQSTIDSSLDHINAHLPGETV